MSPFCPICHAHTLPREDGTRDPHTAQCIVPDCTPAMILALLG